MRTASTDKIGRQKVWDRRGEVVEPAFGEEIEDMPDSLGSAVSKSPNLAMEIFGCD